MTDSPEPRDCADEVLHLGTTIQPHGALLAARVADGRILFASDGCARLVGLGPADLWDRGLADVLGRDTADALLSADAGRSARRVSTQAVDGTRRAFDCVAHRSTTTAGTEVLVVELEDRDDVDAHGGDAWGLGNAAIDPHLRVVHETRLEAQDCGTTEQLAVLLAERAREFTGFDRVLVYRFLPNGDGEVIGESFDEGYSSLEGLRFPSSDIPEQARRLYETNLLRLIVDTEAVQDPLRAAPALGPDERLDLTRSGLRSVAEVHLQYLRNMDVRSSMSVSLLKAGRLWGMILFHHRTPRFVPHAIRGACELLGAVMAPRFDASERATGDARRKEREGALRAGVAKLVDADFDEDVGEQVLELLCRIFEADGAVVQRDDDVLEHGFKIREQLREELLERALEGDADQLAVVHDLASGWRGEALETPSGAALAVAVTPSIGVVLLRRATPKRIRWAGDPTKALNLDAAGLPRPRTDFAPFVQELVPSPRSWSAADRALAVSLRDSLVARMLRGLVSMSEHLDARMRALTRHALRRSRLQALIEIGDIGVWEFDVVEGRVVEDHWVRTLGYEAGEVEPTLDGFRTIGHPDDVERVLENFEAFVGSDTATFHESFRMYGKDGRLRFYDSRSAVIRTDADGRPLRVLGLLYPLESDAAPAEDFARQSEEMEALLYSISHDLKSPLVTARGFVGLARQDLDDEDLEAARGDLDRIEAATERMSLLIDDLLVMSRIGRIAFLREPLDLAELFAEIQESYEVRYAERGATLTYDDATPLVVGDRSTLSRAVENLVTNALLHACDEPGRTVHVGADRVEHEVHVHVRDDGPGIEPRFHRRIFGLFKTLGKSSKGTGVGLASVAKAARVHGGRAWVESTPGEGATFWIALPASTPD